MHIQHAGAGGLAAHGTELSIMALHSTHPQGKAQQGLGWHLRFAEARHRWTSADRVEGEEGRRLQQADVHALQPTSTVAPRACTHTYPIQPDTHTPTREPAHAPIGRGTDVTDLGKADNRSVDWKEPLHTLWSPQWTCCQINTHPSAAFPPQRRAARART